MLSHPCSGSHPVRGRAWHVRRNLQRRRGWIPANLCWAADGLAAGSRARSKNRSPRSGLAHSGAEKELLQGIRGLCWTMRCRGIWRGLLYSPGSRGRLNGLHRQPLAIRINHGLRGEYQQQHRRPWLVFCAIPSRCRDPRHLRRVVAESYSGCAREIGHMA